MSSSVGMALISMPVRSDAGAGAQCFASLSARGCLRTRRDELVGTLSEQQI